MWTKQKIIDGVRILTSSTYPARFDFGGVSCFMGSLKSEESIMKTSVTVHHQYSFVE